MTKIAFIGAGSTIFMRHIVGDALLRPALADAHVALMDIDAGRLAESELVARKMVATLGAPATVSATTDRRAALEGADFVIVAFQIGGYDPCTITDFEIPKKYGLRQTIGDTLGVAGIMRGLRTVPHLWALCEDMRALCPDALMLQYANPMAINCWAMAAKYPDIKQVGLCHSVPNTAQELTHDLNIPLDSVRYRVAGINHVAFFLDFERRQADGTWRDLYPDLREGYLAGRIPKPPLLMPRCENRVRYDMMMRLGYFLTESSEHFAEYSPWYIKRGRDDLIETYAIPLDEYPKRCIEQAEEWKATAGELRSAERIEVEESNEFAATIMNAVLTGESATIYGNVRNDGLIDGLPPECIVELPCLVDANGIQPTRIGALPPQLTAMIRTQIGVQELTVAALMEENRERIFQAAMFDPHTSADLDLDQIWTMTAEMIAAHGDWLPGWAQGGAHREAAE